MYSIVALCSFVSPHRVLLRRLLPRRPSLYRFIPYAKPLFPTSVYTTLVSEHCRRRGQCAAAKAVLSMLDHDQSLSMETDDE